MLRKLETPTECSAWCRTRAASLAQLPLFKNSYLLLCALEDSSNFSLTFVWQDEYWKCNKMEESDFNFLHHTLFRKELCSKHPRFMKYTDWTWNRICSVPMCSSQTFSLIRNFSTHNRNEVHTRCDKMLTNLNLRVFFKLQCQHFGNCCEVYLIRQIACKSLEHC